MPRKNAFYAQSGGVTAVINASACGVIETARNDTERWLVDTGLIYKALRRLESVGALTSRWEDPEIALAERRPRRRYHSLTSNGDARADKAPLFVRQRRRRLRIHREDRTRGRPM